MERRSSFVWQIRGNARQKLRERRDGMETNMIDKRSGKAHFGCLSNCTKSPFCALFLGEWRRVRNFLRLNNPQTKAACEHIWADLTNINLKFCFLHSRLFLFLVFFPMRINEMRADVLCKSAVDFFFSCHWFVKVWPLWSSSVSPKCKQKLLPKPTQRKSFEEPAKPTRAGDLGAPAGPCFSVNQQWVCLETSLPVSPLFCSKSEWNWSLFRTTVWHLSQSHH